MHDEELLERALAGDESAFVRLLDAYEQPLFAYFRQRHVRRSDAEDLTQSVFMVLLDQGRRFDARRGSLRAFAFGIARRVWLKHAARRGKDAAALPADVVDERTDSPDAALERMERKAIVAEAIASLPDMAREVLTMRMHHDLSIAEIAEALDIPPNTVKSHLFRGRNQLRQSITAKLEIKEGG